jgi:hypothetical protein
MKDLENHPAWKMTWNTEEERREVRMARHRAVVDHVFKDKKLVKGMIETHKARRKNKS